MIELRNINFRYAGGTDAGGLVNIDLIIPDGQVILLCGQSGCGKTTLTRLVNGLIPNDYEGELCTGISPVCQSWQWMTSGLKPITGRDERAALQKKENFSRS